MMETTDKWHLVRNDNGEWISDENVVFLSELEATVLIIRAAEQKKHLSVQHGAEGQLWCYRHEFDAIEMSAPPIPKRELRIKKTNTK